VVDRNDFAYLVGAGPDRIRWGHALMLASALFIADILGVTVFPSITFLLEREGPFSPYFGDPLSLIESILTDLVLAVVLLIAIRLISYRSLALVGVAVVFPVISAAVGLAIRFALVPSDIREDLPLELVSNYLVDAGFVLLVIGGMALATYFLKIRWIALPLGAALGRCLLRVVVASYRSMTDPDAVFSALAPIFGLVSGFVLGLAFWLLIAGSEPDADVPDPAGPTLARDLYTGSWAFAGVTVVLASALTIIGMVTENWAHGLFIGAVALMFLVCVIAAFSTILYLKMVYKMWAAIQDGTPRTTPGRAVGFLFIPIFNLYWIFQVFPGFADDFNDHVRTKNLAVKELPKGVFTAYGILLVCGLIPVVSFVTAIAALVVGFFMIGKICDAVNALPQPTTRGA
jgi:hypothetical protein